MLAGGNATATPGHIPKVPLNFDVSQMVGNHAEDTIAINPRDSRNVVAVSMTSSLPSGLFVGATFNGGRTWVRHVIGRGGPLGEICCDEDLGWDHYGNLWLSYLLNTNGNVVIAVSTDGGIKFTNVTEIVPAQPAASAAHPGGARPGMLSRPRTASAVMADQPHISVGPHSVWVSYNSFVGQAAVNLIQASGARVDGLGRFGSFIPPESVPTANGAGDYGDTAVGPHGQVMVVYESNIGTRCCSRIYTALDPDGLGPRGFGRPRLLARSNVGGQFDIPAQPRQGLGADPKLAWDFGRGRYHGRVYAIWTQATPRNSNNLNVMLRYSDNNGQTWSRPMRLSDRQTVNGQFFPAIAVDQVTGHVAVGWYQCRNARGEGRNGCRRPDSFAQFWATYSTDGGATFAPDFRVSEGTSNASDTDDVFDYGDYTHVAFQAHLFYPAWSDNSNSTGDNPNGTLRKLDLYTARVVIP